MYTCILLSLDYFLLLLLRTGFDVPIENIPPAEGAADPAENCVSPPDPKAGGAAAAAPKLKPAGLAELAGAPHGVAVDWVGAAEPKAGAAPEPWPVPKLKPEDCVEPPKAPELAAAPKAGVGPEDAAPKAGVGPEDAAPKAGVDVELPKAGAEPLVLLEPNAGAPDPNGVGAEDTRVPKAGAEADCPNPVPNPNAGF